MIQDDMQLLTEKIEYEFERFSLETIRTSRANIFAASKEIEIKKSVRFHVLNLLKTNSLDQNTITALLMENNVLDAIYCSLERDCSERILSDQSVTSGINQIIGKNTEVKKHGSISKYAYV